MRGGRVVVSTIIWALSFVRNNLSIVVDQVHPIMVTSHGARVLQEWFRENKEDFAVFVWPPHPLDLNPIISGKNLKEPSGS